MLKRVFLLLGTGTFFILMTASFPLFKMEQNCIQSEIKRQLKQTVPVEELHSISFGKAADVHWIKPDKEFSLHGHLYDVVQNVSKDGKVQFLCINDTEEEALFADLESRVLNRQNKRSGSHQFVLLWSANLYFAPVQPEIELQQAFFTGQMKGGIIANHLGVDLPGELLEPPRS